MKLLARRLPGSPLLLLSFSASALAQDEPRPVSIPNPMSAHTWFIIAAIGAFLLWCISYTLQLQKEALVKKKGREDLLGQKENLLDKIADLETRRENNDVSDPRYRRELKHLRHSLAKVLEGLRRAESQTAKSRSTGRM